ncbi:Unknown protein sequence [Pseudomonas coronafaciens pv. oryzae]|nr:Unknown protein sequence [Pseudomonas coronafaciens pv. oryzae]
MECIRAIARLKSIDLNLGDSFDSIQKTLKVVGYKFVVRRSDI